LQYKNIKPDLERTGCTPDKYAAHLSGQEQTLAKGPSFKGFVICKGGPLAKTITGKNVSNHTSIFDKVIRYNDAETVRGLGLYPYFREIESGQDTEVIIQGKKVLMLGSNSYLGLTNDPRVKKAAIDAIEKYGTGCAGSRFLNGSLDIHTALEERLAAFVDKEAAVVFSTGFMANLGFIAAVVQRGDYILADRLDHASIIDGANLSFGRLKRFEHNDPSSLEAVLKSIPLEAGKLIVIDGIFSMDGDIADLPRIVPLAEKYNTAVMVDDAHSLGVIGPRGEGTAAHFGLQDRIDAIMGTFSKSLATVGGFIAGNAKLIDFLRHTSRALMFSASLPPASVAAVMKSLDIIEQEPERREALWENTTAMAEGLVDLGYDIGSSNTPVIPILIGGMKKTFRMCIRLQEEGVFVNPVVPPAVPQNRSLIRISLMATHTRQQIDMALSYLKKVGRELNVI
jgi:8-amino-7-oxononanoate synthase